MSEEIILDRQTYQGAGTLDGASFVVQFKAVRLARLKYGPAPEEERALCHCYRCRPSGTVTQSVSHTSMDNDGGVYV